MLKLLVSLISLVAVEGFAGSAGKQTRSGAQCSDLGSMTDLRAGDTKAWCNSGANAVNRKNNKATCEAAYVTRYNTGTANVCPSSRYVSFCQHDSVNNKCMAGPLTACSQTPPGDTADPDPTHATCVAAESRTDLRDPDRSTKEWCNGGPRKTDGELCEEYFVSRWNTQMLCPSRRMISLCEHDPVQNKCKAKDIVLCPEGAEVGGPCKTEFAELDCNCCFFGGCSEQDIVDDCSCHNVACELAD